MYLLAQGMLLVMNKSRNFKVHFAGVEAPAAGRVSLVSLGMVGDSDISISAIKEGSFDSILRSIGRAVEACEVALWESQSYVGESLMLCMSLHVCYHHAVSVFGWTRQFSMPISSKASLMTHQITPSQDMSSNLVYRCRSAILNASSVSSTPRTRPRAPSK